MFQTTPDMHKHTGVSLIGDSVQIAQFTEA